MTTARGDSCMPIAWRCVFLPPWWSANACSGDSIRQLRSIECARPELPRRLKTRMLHQKSKGLRRGPAPCGRSRKGSSRSSRLLSGRHQPGVFKKSPVLTSSQSAGDFRAGPLCTFRCCLTRRAHLAGSPLLLAPKKSKGLRRGPAPCGRNRKGDNDSRMDHQAAESNQISRRFSH